MISGSVLGGMPEVSCFLNKASRLLATAHYALKLAHLTLCICWRGNECKLNIRESHIVCPIFSLFHSFSDWSRTNGQTKKQTRKSISFKSAHDADEVKLILVRV